MNKKLSKLLLVPALVIASVLLFHAPAAQAQDFSVFYNACTVGPICDLCEQYYSPGDYVLDDVISFPAEEEKIIPHPYYEEYKDFTCKADECLVGVSDTTYCVSPTDDEIPAIRLCTAITLPNCNLNECQDSPSSSPYCDIGAVRFCDSSIYALGGWHFCTTSGWDPTAVGGTSGDCIAEPPHPIMGCDNGTVGVPGSGNWIDLPSRPNEQGRCEEMLEEIRVAFTPGYVKTYTPYLFDIWQNTVKHTAAIFTLFRTQIGAEIFDWPGESTIAYDFTNDLAEAGFPPTIRPGWDAKIYFRYLGYIHCAKENLLQKLSSRLADTPYVYYDARCDAELW
ncbi:hypothetical protein IH980_02735 [Patescibacteria group bacterium]|nr:hypothetical protein [Patescibacteria group bacterium]